MKTEILLILLYYIEVTKFTIANKVFFGDETKKKWLLIVTGIFYSIIVWNFNYKYSYIHIIMYILVFSAFFFTQKENIETKLFKVFVLLLVTSCIDSSSGIFFGYFYNCGKISINTSRLLESILTLSILVFFHLFKIKEKINRKSLLSFVKKKVIFAVIFMIVCLILNITGVLYLQRYVSDRDLGMFIDILSLTALACMVGVVVFIIYIKNANEKMEILIETERNLKQMQENYYTSLLEREENTRRYRHDMIGHLLCLDELSKSECAEETTHYIQNLMNNLFVIQKKCYVTGNKILDILLNYYLLQISNADISITGMCNCELNISDVDFCVIFSNIIQNAIEEIQRQDYGKKYFEMKIVQGTFYLEIEIRNSLLKINGHENDCQIKSKKTDKRNHGFGIKSIDEMVKKNRGTIKINQRDNEFSVLTVLRCQKK